MTFAVVCHSDPRTFTAFILENKWKVCISFDHSHILVFNTAYQNIHIQTVFKNIQNQKVSLFFLFIFSFVFMNVCCASELIVFPPVKFKIYN